MNCNKKIFKSQSEAKRFSHMRCFKKKSRTYYCKDCAGYHLTTNMKMNGQKEREKEGRWKRQQFEAVDD